MDDLDLRRHRKALSPLPYRARKRQRRSSTPFLASSTNDNVASVLANPPGSPQAPSPPQAPSAPRPRAPPSHRHTLEALGTMLWPYIHTDTTKERRLCYGDLKTAVDKPRHLITPLTRRRVPCLLTPLTKTPPTLEKVSMTVMTMTKCLTTSSRRKTCWTPPTRIGTRKKASLGKTTSNDAGGGS